MIAVATNSRHKASVTRKSKPNCMTPNRNCFFAILSRLHNHGASSKEAVAFRSRPYSKPCSDFIAKGLCGSASQLMAKAVNNSKICNHFSVFVS